MEKLKYDESSFGLSAMDVLVAVLLKEMNADERNKAREKFAEYIHKVFHFPYTYGLTLFDGAVKESENIDI